VSVEDNKQNDKAAIQRLLDDGIRSVRSKNIEGVMSLCAPEVVSFDIVPPLRLVGADAYRKHWKELFFVYQGPIDYEMHDLSITVGDDVAFAYSLNRISGTMGTGQKTGFWLRSTTCFRKIGGTWLLVHTQSSVPVDVVTGRAVLDLRP
jgi:ketosteroid isomerase-like protein